MECPVCDSENCYFERGELFEDKNTHKTFMVVWFSCLKCRHEMEGMINTTNSGIVREE